MPDIAFEWKWPNWIYPVRRITPSETNRVQLYINAIVRRDYPYQVRGLMGRHLWVEFCEYFALNPDVERGMKYL